MVLKNKTSLLLLLTLVCTSAYAGKCNDDPNVVQDPAWYRLRIKENEQAQNKLMEIYHDWEKYPNAMPDAEALKARVLSIKKLLKDSTWKYNSSVKDKNFDLDLAYTALSNGIAMCSHGELTCHNEKLMKKTYKITQDVAADMRAKLDSLKGCDVAAKAESNQDMIAQRTKKIKKQLKTIASLKGLIKACKNPTALSTSETTTFSEIIQKIPDEEYKPSVRSPATETKKPDENSNSEESHWEYER